MQKTMAFRLACTAGGFCGKGAGWVKRTQFRRSFARAFVVLPLISALARQNHQLRRLLSGYPCHCLMGVFLPGEWINNTGICLLGHVYSGDTKFGPEKSSHNLCICYLYWRDISFQGKGNSFSGSWSPFRRHLSHQKVTDRKIRW